MTEDLETGWLNVDRRIISLNFDDRPVASEVSLLVIHNISLPPNEFRGNFIDQLFTNSLDPSYHPYFKKIAHLRVSTHLYIDRFGKVTQYVPLHRRAWHAGESIFKEKSCCNDYSIGIELQGSDDVPYTDRQYDRLGSLTREVQACYPMITVDRIVGHRDIAPDRKTDPGDAFDWKRYLGGLRKFGE